MSELHRCGYCGQPTDKDGRVLSEAEVKAIDANDTRWNTADQTHGECCREQAAYEESVRVVTKEMAIDAGNPDLEGLPY